MRGRGHGHGTLPRVGDPTQNKPLRLNTPVVELPWVRPRDAHALARIDIASVMDLLKHLPMRYEQEAAEGTVAAMPIEAIGSTRGMVAASRMVQGYGRGKSRFEATLRDDTGDLLLTWFNATYLRDRIRPGMTLRVQGKTVVYRNRRQIVNPRWEELPDPRNGDAPAPTRRERLRPIYPATQDLPSWAVEKLLDHVLPEALPLLADPVPADMLKSHAMPPLAEAYRMIHRPEDEEEAGAARRRLAFNELLLLQMGIALKRHYNQSALEAPALRWSEAIDRHIRDRFPFRLTVAQDKVVKEIAADLRKTVPMNRLLQGDVGAGKTVVALYAMLMAVADRKQAALLAPTEILAEQHHLSLSAMLKASNVRVVLLTAGACPPKSAERKASLRRIAAGEIDLVIGTQAILSEHVRFHDLAVVVIDEQHRFGVLQRAVFRSRGREGDAIRLAKPTSPHHLVMTATPIPRTLSLTVFGDLDVSIITGLPPGRQPVVTRVVAPDQTAKVYDYLEERLGRGEQAYVVVPAIDEAGEDTAAQLKSVREHAQHLQKRLGSGYRVAAVHGRLKRQTRESIMHRFRAGQIHVLVATTVIEVGVDVPNASVMIVEHADRFGLAQLHQLRGRVGRGASSRKALCVFIAEPKTESATHRMAAIAAESDGFKIAEKDLEIRGMGDFFGTRQHGLPPLRVARIPDDMDLLQLARRDAEALVAADPALTQATHGALRKLLIQQYGDALGLIDVG